MTTFAGRDVSQAKTTVCIVDERGLVTWRGSCATSPGAIAQTLAARASSLERVGLESGPLTPWLVHELRALELPLLAIAGVRDEGYTAAAKRIAATAPRARAAIVEDAGHAAHLQRPDEVAGLITEFLDEAVRP